MDGRVLAGSPPTVRLAMFGIAGGHAMRSTAVAVLHTAAASGASIRCNELISDAEAQRLSGVTRSDAPSKYQTEAAACNRAATSKKQNKTNKTSKNNERSNSRLRVMRKR